MRYNKKYIIYIISLLVAIFVAIVAYRLFYKSDYRQSIPKQAKAVLCFDFSKWHADNDIPDFLGKEMGGEVEGLDLASPLYAFVTPNEYIGVTAKISDRDKWEHFLSKYLQNARAEAIIESDEYAWAWVKDSWLVAWDNNRLLALGPGVKSERDNLRQLIIALMDEDESFVETEAFETLEKENSALSFYGMLDVFPSPYNLLFRLQLPTDIPMDAVSLIGCMASKTEKGTLLNCRLNSENKDVLSAIASYEKKLSLYAQSTTNVGNIGQIKDESTPLLTMSFLGTGADVVKALRKDAMLREYLIGLNRVVDADKMLTQTEGRYRLVIDSLSENANASFLLTATTHSHMLFDNAPYWLTSAQRQKNVSLTRLSDSQFRLKGEKGELLFGFNSFGNQLYFASPENVSKVNATEKTNTSFASTDVLLYFALNLNKLSEQPSMKENGISDIIHNLFPDIARMEYFSKRGNKVQIIIK